MANLAHLKRELEKVSSTTSNQDNKWKPPVGKSIIRFIPYRFDENVPFRTLKFHYELKPAVMCLENFEEGSCPICKAGAKAYQAGKDDVDSRNLSKKLYARSRHFAPIFVRSENGKDVNEMKIWGFGKQIYKQILDFYDEYDLDFTDVTNAPDIIIKYEDPEAGETFGKTTIMVDPKTLKTPKPLAASKKEIDSIIESVPEIESTFQRKTAEEAIEILKKFMDTIDAPSNENKEKSTIDIMKSEKSLDEDEDEDEDDKIDKELADLLD